MQCPACGPNLPAGKERCLYFAACVPEDLPTTEGDRKTVHDVAMLCQKGEKATVAPRGGSLPTEAYIDQQLSLMRS